MLLLSVFAVLLVATLCQADDIDYEIYQSRPDLRPPKLQVTVKRDGIEPGYILMSPFKLDQGQNTAMIYDTNGDVVWSGFGLSGGSRVFDFHFCMYNNSPHFCYLVGHQEVGFSRGHMNLLDTTLSVVKQVKPQNGKSPLDQHETNLSYDKKSALVDTYHPQRHDLSAYGITGQGWIQNTIFQRINIETGELEFEWSPIDHIPLSESYTSPVFGTFVSAGRKPQAPWDYFHINAIDENDDGDYYISARHTDAIYKLDGHDGHVIWRLGGKQSDFEFPHGLNFSSQHHVRMISHNATSEILSLFDNASDGIRSTAEHSKAVILKLDHTSTPPRVVLLKSFHPPKDQIISDSQGSLQIYDPKSWETSHALVCWGSQPVVNEYDTEGNIIFAAHIRFKGAASYRGYKVQFDTDPYDAPALYTYAKAHNASTIYYMSWNGATRVKAWRIYGKSSVCGAYYDWTVVYDSTLKTGFETMFVATGQFYDLGMVEALDADHRGIKNSSAAGVKTFVPGAYLAASCDNYGCPLAAKTVDPNRPKQDSVSDVQKTMSQCRPHGWR